MIGLACALAALALVDGACSGFRSGAGRTGLVRHRDTDLRSAVRGTLLVSVLLSPTAALSAGALTADRQEAHFVAAGQWMLWILTPYAAVVTVALIAYAILSWRLKYLAMAMVLGPLTLIRPAVAVAAGAAGMAAGSSWLVATAVALSVAAALAVEPLMNRRWRPMTTDTSGTRSSFVGQ